MLCRRSSSIGQNIHFIAYGRAYFELVWSPGINAPGLYSFEGNLVYALQSAPWQKAKCSQEVTIGVFCSEAHSWAKLILMLTQMYPLCLHLRKKWRNIIHTQTEGLCPSKNVSFKILTKELETLRLQYCKYDPYFHAQESTQTGFSGTTTCCHFSKAFKYVYAVMCRHLHSCFGLSHLSRKSWKTL